MKIQYIILLFSASLGNLISSTPIIDLNSRTEMIELLEKDQNFIQEELMNPKRDENLIRAFLWEAIINNHQPTVELYLQCPFAIDIELPDDEGRTPLFLACLYGHENIVKLLIKRGANVNTKEPAHGYSALTAACHGGYTNIANLLIKNGALINHIDKLGRTEIAIMAYAGKTSMIQYLIKSGADINLPQSITPLMAAMQTGNIVLVDFLLKNNANIKATDVRGCSIIFYAVFSKNIEMVEYAIKLGCDVNSKDYHGFTPLFACLRGKYRDIEILKLLIKHGANVNDMPSTGNFKDHSLLSLAAYQDSAAVEILLKNGALRKFIEKPQDSELLQALINPHETKEGVKKIIKLLLENAPIDTIHLARQITSNEISLEKPSDSPYHLDILRETMLELGLIKEKTTESRWPSALKYCALIASSVAALGSYVVLTA